LAHIQPETLQNVQKLRFWQKAPGLNGSNKEGTLKEIFEPVSVASAAHLPVITVFCFKLGIT